MNKFSILGGAALLAITIAASAQPPGGPDGPRGPRVDRDADISRAQVIERTDQRFARLDANHDGRFTPEEARARHEQRRERMAERMFDRFDLDRNGSITREEMSQARARHRAERGERGPGARGPGMRHRRMGMHRGGPGMRGMGGMRGQRLFGEQGFVTAEQFRERALARFDRLDADRNGTVTAAERQAAREQRRERRHERRGERQRPS